MALNSFVEIENARRSRDRSKHILTGDVIAADERFPIYVMELRRNSCRGVVSMESTPPRVNLNLPIPENGSIVIAARATWLKQLSPNSWHVSFDDFEFSTKSHKQVLNSYLNQILVESEELGVRALRSLGDEELSRLSRFVNASRSLNPCQSYIDAISQVVDVMRKTLGAERGLFLVDWSPDKMGVEVVRGSAAKERGVQFSSTVTGQVSANGKPLLSLDAQSDLALGEVNSIKMLGTVSVMCLPLRTPEREFGYVYLDNSISRGIFRDADLALATIMTDLATGCLEKNWQHQIAVQAERVAANRSLVSSLSRELEPNLNIVQQIAHAIKGQGEMELLRQKVDLCVEFMQTLKGATRYQRDGTASDLMEVIEEIALDLGDNVEIPLPPTEGWPKIDMNMTSLAQVITDLVHIAHSGAEDKTKVMVAALPNLLKVTVYNPSLELSYMEFTRIFHPSQSRSLSETQRLVHEHRGLLRVHKDPVGGTVFTAEFSLMADPTISEV